MSWITATSLDGREINLQTRQIAAFLQRVPGEPREGTEVLLSSGTRLEVKESPAELLRAIESEEHPENPSASPDMPW
jgi:hypothetical protein